MATLWARPAALDLTTVVPGATAFTGVVMAVVLALLLEDGDAPPRRDDGGILPCPAGASADLLAAAALQCWMEAPNGRWRTLSRVSAHGALVIEIETTAISDAEEITRRFVADRGGRFSEVLAYVQPEGAVAPVPIRRVRWTAATGFEQVNFTVSPTS